MPASSSPPGSSRAGRLALAALLAVGLFAAAGYAVAGDVVPTQGGTYVEAVVGVPRYLNPLLAQPGSPDDDVVALVFSGLTRVGSDGKVAPDLATDWSVAPNGLQYTFRLRRGVRWHDGHPFGAGDVVATVQALQAVDFPGDAALAALWKDVRVEPTDEGVRFTLPAPDAAFPEQASLGILPASALAGMRGRAMLESDFNLRPIGTGPMRVTSAELRRIELTAFDGYWERAPYVPNVEFRFVGTAAAALDLLRRGEVTAVRPLPARDAASLPSGAIAYLRPEISKTDTLVFNTSSAPLDDVPTRAALAKGIDRRKAAGALGAAAVPVDGEPGDASAAKAALQAAGWRAAPDGTLQRGDRQLRLTLVTNDAPERGPLAEELVRQLAAVGVRVELQRVPWAALVGDVLPGGRWGAALVETFEPQAVPDPGRLWGKGAPLNFGGWAPWRSEELLAAARRATTPAARLAALRDWQALFDAEAPAVRLLHPQLSYPVAAELRGQSIGPAFLLPRDRFASYADWYLFTKRAPGRF
ncbi:MAG TPA: ABC transporter substrate-binding protein [Chloroflexota bacterium]|nr:ABC transporter substrate-binding protein [Chloroflexota bacterium]